MLNAWNEVAAYVAANAENPRKGYRLGEMTDEAQLKYTVQEFLEWFCASGDLSEFADLLGCLFH